MLRIIKRLSQGFIYVYLLENWNFIHSKERHREEEQTENIEIGYKGAQKLKEICFCVLLIFKCHRKIQSNISRLNFYFKVLCQVEDLPPRSSDVYNFGGGLHWHQCQLLIFSNLCESREDFLKCWLFCLFTCSSANEAPGGMWS